jgi:hypothetical protein
MQIAEHAFDAQSVAADGRKMLTARQEGYVMAGGRQPSTEIAAYSACRQRYDAHENPQEDAYSSGM